MDYRYESIIDTDKCYYYFIKTQNAGCTPHFHRGAEFVYVAEGEHTVTINGVTRTLKKDEMSVVKPFEMHNYRYHDHALVYVLLVNDYYLSDFYSGFNAQFFDTYLTDTVHNTAAREVFTHIDEAGDCRTPLMMKGYVNVLLEKLRAVYPICPILKTKSQNLLAEIIAYLVEHSKEDITLDTVAEHFSYNKYYISKFFNRRVGIGLKVYLNMVRMAQVKSVLARDRDADLLRVVLDAGFGSLGTYYRTLQMANGLSEHPAGF